MTTIRTSWTVLLVVGVLLTACGTGWSGQVDVQEITEIDDEGDAIALCDYLLEDVSDEELGQLTGRGAEPGEVSYGGSQPSFSCYVDATSGSSDPGGLVPTEEENRGMFLDVVWRAGEDSIPPEVRQSAIAPVEGEEAAVFISHGGEYPDLDETLAAQITQNVAQKISLDERDWP